MSIKTILKNLAVESEQKGCSTGRAVDGIRVRYSCRTVPVDGSLLGNVQTASVEDYEDLIERAEHAFLQFSENPSSTTRGTGASIWKQAPGEKIGPGAVGLVGDGKIPPRGSGRSARDDRHL